MATESIDNFNLGQEKAGLPDEAIAPDGPYTLEIKKAECKESKGDASKGKPPRPMIAITCHIVSGPFAGLPVWHNFVYTAENPTAKRMFFGQLSLLGIPNPTTLAQTAHALVGRSFQANLGHRSFNGTDSNTIERILGLVGAPAAGGVPTPTAMPTAAPAPVPTPQVPDATPAAAVPAPAPAPAPVAEAPAADLSVPKPPF